MFKPHNLDHLSIPDLEKMNWYEFVSTIGLTSFNLHGTKPIELIAKEMALNSGKKVLVLGCGAGGTSIYIAEITGAMIYGIDINTKSIQEALLLKEQSSAKALLHFQAARKIQEMEKIQSDLTQLTFHIPFTTDYETIMAQAGFKNIHIIETYKKVQSREMIKAIGGWKNLWKISKWMLKIIWKSPKLRHDFIKQGEVKRVIIRDKRTAKFIIQAVMIGEKTN